jgi:chromate reductase, NAD(P)H dehydrogenase (quinone)
MGVLGIAGSLRRDSHNRTLLRAAATLLPPTAEFVEYEGLASLPAYNEDIDTPLAPAALRRAIADANALIISTPSTTAPFPRR